MLYDCHCHLAPTPDMAAPAGYDQTEVAGRLLCGVEPAEWDTLSTAVAGWLGSRAAYGVHPWHAHTATGDWLDRLERFLLNDAESWVGEIGLDAIRVGEAPAEVQATVFHRQLRLARRLGRQVNLHCVKAWDGLLTALDNYYLVGDSSPDFIVHSFAGPHQVIVELSRRGAYFSVGPLFSRRASRRHRERTALLPLDRLLLESDAFLVPPIDAVDDLAHSLEWLAAVRSLPVPEMSATLSANTRRILFHG